ncbi:2370_t:CDS:2, partial [Gigaspora margarita]
SWTFGVIIPGKLRRNFLEHGFSCVDCLVTLGISSEILTSSMGVHFEIFLDDK